jgi:hypothetical protein
MATAASRYETLSQGRNTILRQAQTAASLTIPGLIPQPGQSDPHDISTQPYSSLGARGVNNVAAKLLLSLFPPQRPFFTPTIEPQTAAAMGTTLGPAQAALAEISTQAMDLIEASGSRPLWMEVFRHLIVAGNVLVFHPDDGTVMRMWRLDQFVVRRDAQGRFLEIVVEEEIYPSELDPSVLNAVKVKVDEQKPGEPPEKTADKIKLYTMVLRDDQDNIVHFQEVNGVEVPGSRGQVKADVSGWQPLRWQAVPGSDYGRSMVSEYAGDFLSMEEGWKSILQFAAEAARIVTILDPNSAIDAEELAEADTGDVLTGYVDKIGRLQLEKQADFSALWNILQSIERRVSQAFLLTANTIRDAERVTAEEIRAVAQELEDAFGGAYTVLSAEAQAPYARRILYILNKLGQAPKLPPSVSIQVVTGFAALGQNHETAAILEWLQALEGVFGPNWVATYINGNEVALRTGTAQGITDVKGLIKDADTVAAEQQNNMNSQATQDAVPGLVKGAMDIMAKNPEAGAKIAEQVNGASQG